MATSKTATASASKKSTAGKTATQAKKAPTAKKPAAKKATRKKSTEIVEVEVINEGTYMSDVARKLAGNYDVEAREKELAPMIRAKISGTLESRDQTKYTQMAAVAAIVGDAFAHYMVPATVDNGAFEDGYMARYMFDVGAVAFILAAMLARRAFRAACAAYVRRLDANGEGDSHGDDAHEGCGRE